jgi:hypothetical protein
MDILNSLPGVILPVLMFYFCFWIPFRRVRGAMLWRRTPCLIVASAVSEDAGDSGLYRILVTYDYDVAGRRYRSSRYSFSPASTAGYRWKKRAVTRLASGATAFCYVNPANPSDAVIDRGLTWDMVFMGGFAIVVFVAFAVSFLARGG